MGKATGFIEFERKAAPYRDASVRMLDFDEIYTEHDDERLAIRFTDDGSDPAGPHGRRYRGPIRLDRTTTIRARASDGQEWSATTARRFEVGE